MFIIITMIMLAVPAQAFSGTPAGVPVYSAIFIVEQDRYFVNNEMPGYEMDMVPVIEQDRVFVPVRFLGRALGVPDNQITWDGNKRQVILTKGRHSVKLTVGKKEIIINDRSRSVNVSPLKRADRVMLPARFVAEALGYQVAWDKQNSAVIIFPVGGHRPEISNLFTARTPALVSREINVAGKRLLVTHGARNLAWSPDGSKIAFVTMALVNNVIVKGDIWKVNSYGGKLRQLARHETVELHPTWSPDGKKIAFSSEREGRSGIWMANINDGCCLKRLTGQATHVAHPAWSPDGSKIAFVSLRRDGYYDLWVMRSNGDNLRRLVASEAEEAINFLHPAWSPDSKRIAFISKRIDDSNEDIWVVNIADLNLKQLTTHIKYDGQHAWSPDGKKIAFMSERGGNRDIWVMDHNGNNLRQLTVNEASDEWPTWSPDGTKIAFMSERAGNGDIWVMDSGGSNLKQLTTGEAHDLRPAWSPDGRKIAFLSERAGDYDLWVLILK